MKITIQIGQVVKLLTFIQEVRISNLGRDNSYPEVFRGFSVSSKYWDDKLI
jgi:hypothetical protein